MHRIAVMTIVTIIAGVSIGVAAAQTADSNVPAVDQTQTAPAEGSKPDKIHAAIAYIKERRIIERFTTEDGFYPRIGGLPTGSGFTVGAGYRRHFLRNQNALFRTSALVSTHGYAGFEAEQLIERMGDLGAFAGVKFTALHLPQEDFYGLGPHSTVQDRTDYALDTSMISGTAGIRPFNALRAGARLGYTFAALESGTDPAFPDIERLFDAGTAPGLSQHPNYLITSLFVSMDTRDVPGNPRSGSYMKAEHGFHRERQFGRYSFDRTDLDVQHFIPFFEKKHALALHGRLVVSDAQPGNVVPFYLLPTVGGSNTVRSLREYRFRDRNALFMNAEYRWEVRPMLDMAVFADAGKVSQEIGFAHLKSAIGVGLRFNTDEHVLLRIDVADGVEGTRAYVKFGPSF